MAAMAFQVEEPFLVSYFRRIFQRISAHDEGVTKKQLQEARPAAAETASCSPAVWPMASGLGKLWDEPSGRDSWNSRCSCHAAKWKNKGTDGQGLFRSMLYGM